MVDFGLREFIRDFEGEFVLGGDFFQHVTDGGFVKRAFFFGGHVPAKVRRARADGEHVGRAAVADVLHFKHAFINQSFV